MNAPEKIFLPDVQSNVDRRNLAIQRVGVKDITHPMTVLTARGPQPTVATVDMYVALPPDVKGTHMSRFLDVLQNAHEPVSPAMLQRLMTTMLARLDADTGFVEMRFPYFVMKTAPVSGVESLMDYRVTMRAETKAGVTTVTMQVLVPVTSLCPCSKNISEYGAHNQRSHVTISATLRDELPVEALIVIAEQAASCELWGLLKRPDEKYVTERAYDNPKFVEDLVRDVAIAVEALDAVAAYTVESENFESIHNHSAYALIERVKP
ncbi:MAG: GTP cyclohydrolase I FolE2 [Burkholderiales bacterium]|nr:MAG: GTP cyclohydrolase I FolE2 [Burkholderiales bacterium]